MIFQERYDRFLGACQDINRYRDRVAKPVIDREVLADVHASVSNDALISHIIAESLMRRIDRNLVESKNIYLQKFEISQIDLFYLMCRAYPQVPAGHRIANQFLAHEIRQHEKAALLEIGIGKAVQIASLVGELQKDQGALRSLRIVALDPSTENLADSKRKLEALAGDLPFKLEVVTVNKLIEQCNDSDVRAIGELADAPLVVNSAYSLHHTIHAAHDRESRTEVLRRIALLRPRLFTLVEPNANHDTDHLSKRFHNCWEHFGTVFDLIDEADIETDAKFVIKEKFFGREIRDIFGTSDAFRCERHEPYDSWLFRFAKSGFKPYRQIVLDVPLPGYCTTKVTDGLVRLGYRDLPLIAVFAYQIPDLAAGDERR